MFTFTLKRFFVASFALTLLTGVAYPYSWFEDFEAYADQAAFDSAARWTAIDGKAKGTLSAEHAITTIGQSLLCQQSPVETRVQCSLRDDSVPPVVASGGLSVWFYDDGADIKAFDVVVANGANSVAVGLRDNQAGSATAYTYSVNGTVSSTGIDRSVGWHLIQVAVHSVNGTTMRLDTKTWAGNTLAALLKADTLTIHTNFGNAGDENKIWIDSIRWQTSDDEAYLPHNARVGVIEDFAAGLGNWSGPANVGFYYITDDGAESTGQSMDINADHVGPRYAEATIVGVIPVTGSYVTVFSYQNGPTWSNNQGAWPNLTVAIEGISSTGSINLGNVRNDMWMGATSTAANFYAGGSVTLQVSGDPETIEPTSQPDVEFVRLDRFYIDIVEFMDGPLGAGTWTVYE